MCLDHSQLYVDGLDISELTGAVGALVGREHLPMQPSTPPRSRDSEILVAGGVWCLMETEVGETRYELVQPVVEDNSAEMISYAQKTQKAIYAH